jgi:hypothetical protein
MIAKALTTIFILNFIILLGMVWIPQDNKLYAVDSLSSTLV